MAIPAEQASTAQLLDLEGSLLSLREDIVLELQKLRDLEARAPMDSDYYTGIANAEEALVMLDRDLRKLAVCLEGRRVAGKLKGHKRRALKNLWERLWSYIRRRLRRGQ